jgi:hypothetical protein
MSHRRLLLFVAFVACLVHSESVQAAKDIDRHYPDDATYCPVHLGWRVLDNSPTAPVDRSLVRIEDQLLFTASGLDAVISFVACDNRSFHGIDGAPGIARQIDVVLDDVAVIPRDLYVARQIQNPALDLQHPENPVVSDGCYEYNGFPEMRVGSVANYSGLRPFSWQLPFLDKFEDGAGAGRWMLGNAEIRPDPRPGNAGNHSLFLAERIRSSVPGSPNEDLCSLASIHVTRLVPGSMYLIDFNWRVTGEFDRDDPVMSVFVDANPHVATQ